MREGVFVALMLVPGWASSGRAEIHQTTSSPSGVPETAFTYFQQVEGHRFDEFLHSIRPSRLSPDAKERMLKILPRADVIDASAGQQVKLRALAPILRYHDRESTIDLKVLRVQPAAVAFLGGAAILITEPALGVLSAEELQAAVAHELGHEYFWDEFELARQQAHYA
jgi:Zn-dependent protease with chaperone function